jgi:hypothetical protein
LEQDWVSQYPEQVHQVSVRVVEDLDFRRFLCQQDGCAAGEGFDVGVMCGKESDDAPGELLDPKKVIGGRTPMSLNPL